jgi:hypothetical protein
VSTVFDVTAITVDGGTPIVASADVDVITISDVTTAPSIVIDQPDTVQSVTVEVPGIQGPPGLQNVFVGPDDPSAGWGMAQKGFIWIEVDV